MNERQKVLYSSFQNTEEGKKELYEYTKKKITETSGPSNFNSLTNLPALRYFFFLTGEIVRERPEQNYAVIVMDITQFKAVNEFLGRSEGDRLLCFIGDILLEYAQNRADTVAGHVRADNFCLFTSWTDRQELIDIALDLKNKVAELPFAYRVILSIGICASEEREPAVNYLKDCATIAMSEIKGKYYADYNFFTENMRTDILRDKRVENDIVDALEHDNIIPFIQPKVDMVTGKIVGGEALARWRFDQEIISPAQFIPVIERNGLVIDVDFRICEQVVQYQKRVLEEGRTPVPISVNVSRMHKYEKKPLNDVAKELWDKYQVPPQYIPVELTESAFAPGENEVYDKLQKLKEKGFTISMDDFGSGYSSLNMLTVRDLDEIKLDKAFIDEVHTEKGKIVLKHLLAMLTELGVKIIAEGVETKEQRDFLVENGCRVAQGFYYHRPMPVDEFDELLKKQV
jgi:diguanylate cyclase (GGDEF)-like protein